MLKGKTKHGAALVKIYSYHIYCLHTSGHYFTQHVRTHIQNYIITEIKLIIPEGQCVEKYSCLNGGWSGKTFVR